ncbi:MAG: hypothetical protein RLY93_20015 [Sumerlaeia bacterium]
MEKPIVRRYEPKETDLPWFAPMPYNAKNKPPERYRQEEMFLMALRLLLLLPAVLCVVYGVLVILWDHDRLMKFAVNTPHDEIQWGARIFLIFELPYYLILSRTFRGWRDWGLWIWGFCLAALIFGFAFSIQGTVPIPR